MDDKSIIALFNERSQEAIKQMTEKYGNTALGIALNILNNGEDARECLNDSLLALWNRIPPESPDPLRTYFFRTIRNQAIKKYRSNTAQKRNSFYNTALEELENVLSSENDLENEINIRLLTEAVNRFLEDVPEESRIMFVRRYFYGDSVKNIADITGRSPHFVSVRLSRIREKLKIYLRKEDLI